MLHLGLKPTGFVLSGLQSFFSTWFLPNNEAGQYDARSKKVGLKSRRWPLLEFTIYRALGLTRISHRFFEPSDFKLPSGGFL